MHFHLILVLPNPSGGPQEAILEMSDISLFLTHMDSTVKCRHVIIHYMYMAGDYIHVGRMNFQGAQK